MVADATPQPGEVHLGLREAVDVIDPDTREGRMVGEASGNRVDHLRDGGLLGTHGDEVVDGEEPSDVARRVTPPLQPVVLAFERLGDIEVSRARREREAQRPVPNLGPTIALADRDATGGDELIERIAELGHDHLAVGRIPVDVEPGCRRRVRAVSQQLPPADVEVGLGDRHVIGHVIDDHAQSVVAARRRAVRAAPLRRRTPCEPPRGR